jgi:hypothetical protein
VQLKGQGLGLGQLTMQYAARFGWPRLPHAGGMLGRMMTTVGSRRRCSLRPPLRPLLTKWYWRQNSVKEQLSTWAAETLSMWLVRVQSPPMHCVIDICDGSSALDGTASRPRYRSHRLASRPMVSSRVDVLTVTRKSNPYAYLMRMRI